MDFAVLRSGCDSVASRRWARGDLIVARRQRNPQLALVVLTVAGAILFSLGWLGRTAVVLLSLFVWWGFFQRTDCRVQTRSTPRCGNPAKGNLRGCKRHKEHGRIKRRAVFGHLGVSDPFGKLTPTWRTPQHEPTGVVMSNLSGQQRRQPAGRVERSPLDVVGTLSGVVGSAAAVIQVVLILVRY